MAIAGRERDWFASRLTCKYVGNGGVRTTALWIQHNEYGKCSCEVEIIAK